MLLIKNSFNRPARILVRWYNPNPRTGRSSLVYFIFSYIYKHYPFGVDGEAFLTPIVDVTSNLEISLQESL